MYPQNVNGPNEKEYTFTQIFKQLVLIYFPEWKLVFQEQQIGKGQCDLLYFCHKYNLQISVELKCRCQPNASMENLKQQVVKYTNGFERKSEVSCIGFGFNFNGNLPSMYIYDKHDKGKEFVTKFKNLFGDIVVENLGLGNVKRKKIKTSSSNTVNPKKKSKSVQKKERVKSKKRRKKKKKNPRDVGFGDDSYVKWIPEYTTIDGIIFFPRVELELKRKEMWKQQDEFLNEILLCGAN